MDPSWVGLLEKPANVPCYAHIELCPAIQGRGRGPMAVGSLRDGLTYPHPSGS